MRRMVMGSALVSASTLGMACGSRAMLDSDLGEPGMYADASDARGPGADAGAGAGDAGAAAHDSGDAGNGNAAFTPITGTEALVAMFLVDDGALIVTATKALHVARDGAIKQSWSAPREVTAAAFDGTYLGIADKAVLTVLDVSLTPKSTATLKETCAAAIMVSGARFVCGPINDWDRVFYVYDATNGALLGTSEKHTYQGLPMQRIAATDAFLTEEGGTFYLYRATAAGSVEYVGDSLDVAQLAASPVVTFVTNPVMQLLNESGVFLSIDLAADAGAFGASEPFAREGILGTLANNESFFALDVAGDGVAGIVGDPYASCASGCALQRIDVVNRKITSSRAHAVAAPRVLVLRHDAVADAAWIAVSDDASGVGTPQGYRIDRLPY